MINPRLMQRFGQDETKLKESLLNRGMREGSQGFNDAMLSFNQGKNDAFSQEALSNRQQALQEIPLARNQVLNEINALNGSQQITGPSFVSTPRANVQPADYQGAANASIAAMNGMQQQKNANMGAIAGLIGGGIQAAGSAYRLSDENAKGPMTKIGKTDDGQKIYAYQYLGGGPMQIGLKAQEVEKEKPEAVMTGEDGLKRVNYALALARKGGQRRAA
jgi:hypothetical protein